MRASTSTRVPRWKNAIDQALSKYPNEIVVQIATLETLADGRVVPRTRSHASRGFLDNAANPGLPLLLSTTDIRTPKVSQLSADPTAEVVWWIDGTNQQFRLKSSIYIVPAPTHPLAAQFKAVLAGVGPHTGLYGFKDYDWEDVRLQTFKAMSPGMKASWARPQTSGTVLEGGQDEAKKWPKQLYEPDPSKEGFEEAKRLWDYAISQFALVVVDPEEVDVVDLSTDPDRRTLFTKKEGAPGIWEETEVVP